MIIYATKQTVDRYGIRMPDEFENPRVRALAHSTYERERGDGLLEWGAKLFYFDRRKCIQFCNFASKLTVILADIKKNELKFAPNAIAENLFNIYSDDKKMTALLERFFAEHPIACYSKLTDRSIISTLNRTQSDYLYDGYRLYDFIEDNILHTLKLNKVINKENPVSKNVNGKREYFFPAEEFAALLKARYAPGKGRLFM
ncbi:MAG: hypothetical protein LUF26_08330 [Firmicutes bacterium]|nr:hypothetical protein [Bacillota bacterium]